MKFVVSTAAVVALMGCMAPEKWRPKKMMALAKESEKGSATQLTKKAAGLKIKEVLKKRRTLDFSKRMESLTEDEEENKIPDVSFLELSQSQKKTLSPPKNRELQSTCSAGYVDCVNGQSNGDDCSVECGGDCCVGNIACFSFTGKVCKDGSCDGEYACTYSSIGTVINGCMGDRSCTFVGYGGAGTGIVSEITDSCNADFGCYQAASFAGEISSIVGSCNFNKACEDLGVGSDLGHVVNSCGAETACFSAVQSSTMMGGITNGCNAVDACKDLGVEQTFYGAIDNCCNKVSECEGFQSIPLQCLEASITSHVLAGCQVMNDKDQVELQCFFDSTLGLPANAEIRLGTCASIGGFAEIVELTKTFDDTVSATLDFTDTVTLDDKEADSFERDFCVRSDIFASDGSTLVGLAARKVDVKATLTYSKIVGVSSLDITLTPFDEGSSSSQFVRQPTVTAILDDCAGSGGPAAYSINDTLKVCVTADDDDVEITLVRDVIAARPSTEIVNSTGVPNQRSAVGSLPSKSVLIQTLMITDFFGTGDSSISLTGKVDLNFVDGFFGRSLSEGRHLQGGSSEQEFTIEVPLKSSYVPDFSEEPGNSAIGLGIILPAFAFVTGVLSFALL